jgi:hypothetical protein
MASRRTKLESYVCRKDEMMELDDNNLNHSQQAKKPDEGDLTSAAERPCCQI